MINHNHYAARRSALYAEKPRPVPDWRPEQLGIHRAVQDQLDVFALPPFVLRGHDTLLRDAMRSAVRRGGGVVALLGDSCTGKTRSAWEAVTACLSDWKLLYPKSAVSLLASLEAEVITGPTIVWLDNAQRLFSGPRGDEAASELLGLCDGTLCVLVLATMWHRDYEELKAPRGRNKDPGANIRALLEACRTIDQREAFRADELDQFQGRVRRDLEWGEAADLARGSGKLCQRLAAAPELLERYRRGSDSPGKALITAAVDARRLGVRGPLPRGFLERTAPGYLSPEQRRAADKQTWLEEGLAWAQEPVKGVISALQAVGFDDEIGQDTSRFDLSDILEQQIGEERWATQPPASLWQAAKETLVDGTDLEALALRALSTARFKIARELYTAAIDCGTYSAFEGLSTLYMETHRIRTTRGVQELIELADRIPDGGTSLEVLGSSLMLIALDGADVEYPDIHVITEDLLRRAWQQGSEEGRSFLSYYLRERGRRREAQSLKPLEAKTTPREHPARVLRLAAEGDIEGLESLTQIVRARSDAFHAIAAAAFAGEALMWRWSMKLTDAGHADLAEPLLRAGVEAGNDTAVRGLVELLDAQGRGDEAEALLRAAAESEFHPLHHLFFRLWPNRPAQARTVLIAVARGGCTGNVLRVLRDLNRDWRPERDRHAALRGIRVLARLGVPAAMLELAFVLWEQSHNLGDQGSEDPAVTRMREEAMGLLIKAAPRHREARRQLGLLAEAQGDLGEAARWFLQAINAGDYDVFTDLVRVRRQKASLDPEETTDSFVVAYGLDADGELLQPW